MTIDERWYTRPDGVRERVSAGGIVVRIERGTLLTALVLEKDIDGYCLPKGGVEPGESIEAAALREIEEEAGLTEVTRLDAFAVLERMSEKRKYWSINHYGLYVTDQVSGTILDTENHLGMDWFPLDALPEMHWPDEARLITSRRNEIYDRVIAAQNPKARKKYFM